MGSYYGASVNRATGKHQSADGKSTGGSSGGTSGSGFTNSGAAGISVVDSSSVDQSSLSNENNMANFYAEYAVERINSELGEASAYSFTYDGQIQCGDGYKLCVSDNQGNTYQINWSGEASSVSNLIKSYLSPSIAGGDNYSEVAFTQYGIKYFNNEESRDEYYKTCEEEQKAEEYVDNVIEQIKEKLSLYSNIDEDSYSIESSDDVNAILKEYKGKLSRNQQLELQSLRDDLKTAESHVEKAEKARENMESYGIDEDTFCELYSVSSTAVGEFYSNYQNGNWSNIYASVVNTAENTGRATVNDLVYTALLESYKDDDSSSLDTCA